MPSEYKPTAYAQAQTWAHSLVADKVKETIDSLILNHTMLKVAGHQVDEVLHADRIKALRVILAQHQAFAPTAQKIFARRQRRRQVSADRAKHVHAVLEERFP